MCWGEVGRGGVRWGGAKEERTVPPKTRAKELCLAGALAEGDGSEAPALPLPLEPSLPSLRSAHRKPKRSSMAPTHKQATPVTIVSMTVMVEGESGSTMLVPTKKKKSALPNQPDMNPKRRLIQLVGRDGGEARFALHREPLNWTRIISSPKIAFQQDRKKLTGLNAESAGFRRVRTEAVSTPAPVQRATNLLRRSKPSHVQQNHCTASQPLSVHVCMRHVVRRARSRAEAGGGGGGGGERLQCVRGRCV